MIVVQEVNNVFSWNSLRMGVSRGGCLYLLCGREGEISDRELVRGRGGGVCWLPEKAHIWVEVGFEEDGALVML